MKSKKTLDEISVLDQPDSADFQRILPLTDGLRWVGVGESIQNCCSLSELSYTSSGYILGTVRASQTQSIQFLAKITRIVGIFAEIH